MMGIIGIVCRQWWGVYHIQNGVDWPKQILVLYHWPYHLHLICCISTSSQAICTKNEKEYKTIIMIGHRFALSAGGGGAPFCRSPDSQGWADHPQI
jgi:hypothetical protein